MELDMLNECTFECTRQSRWKETTQRYIANMLINNMELQQDVLGHRYQVQPTTDFFINERGHIRYIEAPAIRDRIVQKTLTKNVLMPSLRPYLIYDNYASLSMRGTSFARRRLERMLRDYVRKHGTDGYILLIDIKKYFENIDHKVLKQLIAPRLGKEPQDVLDLIDCIIDRSSHTDKGLNLGSEAPQILAVYYLNPVDTFIKVVKGMKYYGRYMDDSFIIDCSKRNLSLLLTEIEEVLSRLKLHINRKKTHIVKLSHGFTFLQIKYSVLPTGKLLKRPAHGKIVRERRRLKAFRRMADTGQMSEGDIYNCYQSWRGATVKDHNAWYKSVGSTDSLYMMLFPIHEEKVHKSRRQLVAEIFSTLDREDFKYIV